MPPSPALTITLMHGSELQSLEIGFQSSIAFRKCYIIKTPDHVLLKESLAGLPHGSDVTGVVYVSADEFILQHCFEADFTSLMKFIQSEAQAPRTIAETLRKYQLQIVKLSSSDQIEFNGLTLKVKLERHRAIASFPPAAINEPFKPPFARSLSNAHQGGEKSLADVVTDVASMVSTSNSLLTDQNREQSNGQNLQTESQYLRQCHGVVEQDEKQSTESGNWDQDFSNFAHYSQDFDTQDRDQASDPRPVLQSGESLKNAGTGSILGQAKQQKTPTPLEKRKPSSSIDSVEQMASDRPKRVRKETLKYGKYVNNLRGPVEKWNQKQALGQSPEKMDKTLLPDGGPSSSKFSSTPNIPSPLSTMTPRETRATRNLSKEASDSRTFILSDDASSTGKVKGIQEPPTKEKLSIVLASSSRYDLKDKNRDSVMTTFIRAHFRVENDLTKKTDVLCIGSGDLKKTSKLVRAVLLGIDIVTDAWLETCRKRKTVVDVGRFFPNVKKFDAQHNTDLVEMWKKCRQGENPLSNLQVYCSSRFHIDIDRDIYSGLEAILDAAGARPIIKSFPRGHPEPDGNDIIVASEDESKDILALQQKGWKVIPIDGISTAALRGGIDRIQDMLVQTSTKKRGSKK